MRFRLRVALLLLVNVLAALYGPILDCDETFNYWEPLHYLAYGRGLQTWEYGPAFALRSYGYVLSCLPLLGLCHLVCLTLLGLGKPAVFFALRTVFGGAAAIVEAWLAGVVGQRFGSVAGDAFFVLLLSAPGVASAAVALLPSATGMLLAMVVLGLWMQQRLAAAVVVSVVAVVVPCWPFVAVLFAPFAAHAMLRAWERSQSRGVLVLFATGLVTGCACLGYAVGVDAWLYGRPVLAAWNLVKYNALTGDDELYGVEPASYYAKNLALNLHVGALLAVIAVPLGILVHEVLPRLGLRPRPGRAVMAGAGEAPTSPGGADALAYMAPGFLWVAIMLSRPHKEERFLYPAYPFLLLAGALALVHIRMLASSLSCGRAPGRIFGRVAVAGILATGVGLGLLRGTSIGAAYGGALQLWTDAYGTVALASLGEARAAEPAVVCVGQEWFRFPGSFFLPGERPALLTLGGIEAHTEGRLGLVRSGFRGQLPQPYGPFPDGAAAEPPQPFNDGNREEMARYGGRLNTPEAALSAGVCDFYVDFVHRRQDHHYAAILRRDKWTPVLSVPFLDATRSDTFARSFLAAMPTVHHAAGVLMRVIFNVRLTQLASVRRFPRVGLNALAEDLEWGQYRLFAAPNVQVGGTFPGAVHMSSAKVRAREESESAYKASASVAEAMGTTVPELAAQIPIAGAEL